jgi:hypothetical protein
VVSLMRIPQSRITGCAQVGLSATVYLRSGSNPFPLFYDQLGVVGQKQEHAAAIHERRVIRLAAFRSQPPVRGSRQKNCPRFRYERPNRRSPVTTGELMYIPKSLFCHTVSATHFEPRFSTLTPITPLSRPEKSSLS